MAHDYCIKLQYLKTDGIHATDNIHTDIYIKSTIHLTSV